MRQILTILLDSYRLLIARKLFWVTLAISFLVALLFASVGFSEKGTTFLFGLFEFKHPAFAEGQPLARQLYLWLFSEFVISKWLGWAAVILALVSTAGIFNEMMQPGSIDVMVSKPISRWRLFITKYIGSLLFVLAQVILFAFVLFLCLGLRLDEWNPKVFLCIPLVTLVFSYLYCVQVLASILTRSTIASLLIVFAFWALLGFVDWVEGGVFGNIERAAQFAPSEVQHDENYDNQMSSIRTWRKNLKLSLSPFPKPDQTTDIFDQNLGLDEGLSLWKLMAIAAGEKNPRVRILAHPHLHHRILPGLRIPHPRNRGHHLRPPRFLTRDMSVPLRVEQY